VINPKIVRGIGTSVVKIKKLQSVNALKYHHCEFALGSSLKSVDITDDR
jgi:hypothetical protein